VSCERVVFSRIRGSGKAAQIPVDGNGSWGGGGRESNVSAGSAPDPSHSTKMLGKMPLTKKSSQEKSHVQEQSLMAAQTLGQAWLL
jgi:hypothetical protein